MEFQVWSKNIDRILILWEMGMQNIVNELGKWEEGMENWKIDY